MRDENQKHRKCEVMCERIDGGDFCFIGNIEEGRIDNVHQWCKESGIINYKIIDLRVPQNPPIYVGRYCRVPNMPFAFFVKYGEDFNRFRLQLKHESEALDGGE